MPPLVEVDVAAQGGPTRQSISHGQDGQFLHPPVVCPLLPLRKWAYLGGDVQAEEGWMTYTLRLTDASFSDALFLPYVVVKLMVRTKK